MMPKMDDRHIQKSCKVYLKLAGVVYRPSKINGKYFVDKTGRILQVDQKF